MFSSLIPRTEGCVWKAEVKDEEHDDKDGDGHAPLPLGAHLLLLLLLLVLQPDVDNSLPVREPSLSQCRGHLLVRQLMVCRLQSFRTSTSML